MINVLFVVVNVTNILALMPYANFRGLQFLIAQSLQEALDTLACQKNISVIIADAALPDGHGVDLLKAINLGEGVTPRFYLLAERCDLRCERRALSLGVHEVVKKPLDIPTLEKIFCPTVPLINTLPPLIDPAKHFCGLVGESLPMENLYHLIKRVAPTEASVFISGQSGSGKELVAQALHQTSLRANKPYLAINCGVISESLMGSALFGHEKGSFTGAVQAHKGYFEQASGGTLFLDEITETSEALQVSLLRVLETMKIMPVGGQRQIDVDVRVLASTNRDPRLAVQQGLLREDLYYRLNIFPILVPTLAERGADIVLLAKHFLSEHNKINKKNTQISAVALAYLQSLSYPGNVRQLKNRLYRAYILADEWIELEHLQES